MKVEIKGITIVRLVSGCDKLFLETDLPAAKYPFEGAEDLILECARGTGESYCRTNFGDVPVKVVE